MEALNIVFLIIIILSAVCIIGLVLMQKSKAGGGLGGLASTGGGMDEAFGTQTATVLTKATVFFIVLFFVATIGIGLNQRFIKIKDGTGVTDNIEKKSDDGKEKATDGEDKEKGKTSSDEKEDSSDNKDKPEK